MLAPEAACSSPSPVTPGPSWTSFRANYVTEDGRVLDVEAGNVSHTEGQGWGMLFAEAANDRDAFERIWRWTDAHLARPDLRLFSWRFDPAAAAPVADPNNATDGDLFIAWALLRAHRRWGDQTHLQISAQIRQAVAARLVQTVAGRTLLLPGIAGFVGPGQLTYNPSYFVAPALKAFAAVEPKGPWSALVSDGLGWATKGLFGRDALPPDWMQIQPDGRVGLDPGHPPRFGFDAVRSSLWLIWAGERKAPAVASIARFWRNGLGPKAQPPAWVDLVDGSTADYALSAGGMAVADLTLQRPARAEAGPRTYYSEALLRLAALARREEGSGKFDRSH